jgi:hypothetical protein
MARCSGNAHVSSMIGGHLVTSNNGEFRCDCNYFLKNGSCRHSAQVKNSVCRWKGEPNMTIIDNKPVKVCPRCGSAVIL